MSARTQEQMIAIRKRLAVFYKRHEIDVWLRSAHPQLNHQRPCDLINDGEGALVEQVLQRLESGAYL
jgi:uncharacterized protein (DUF2384 family)